MADGSDFLEGGENYGTDPDIQWGKLGKRLGRGALYATFVGIIHIIVTAVEGIQSFFDDAATSLGGFVIDLFYVNGQFTPTFIDNAFRTAILSFNGLLSFTGDFGLPQTLVAILFVIGTVYAIRLTIQVVR